MAFVITHPLDTQQTLSQIEARAAASTTVRPLALVNARTATGSPTVVLPGAGTRYPGAAVVIRDADGNAGTAPISVDGNGANLDGAPSAILATDDIIASYVFDGTQWVRVASRLQFGNGGPGVNVGIAYSAEGPEQGSSGGVSGPIVFGSGDDGAAHLNGVTNYAAFSSRVGSVYTLTRDVFLTTLTVDAGVTLVTAGFRLFANTQIVNNGTIHNDGADAVGGTAGAASPIGSTGIGRAGGAGGVNGAGVAGTNQPNGVADGTGAGGAGGAGGVNAGGTGGTYSSPAGLNLGGSNSLVPASLGYGLGTADGINVGVFVMSGGAGGGGGGSDDASIAGGGGGGGAGMLFISAYAIVNNGTIRARGGAGGAAILTPPGAGNGGGGGGGGGGLITVLARFRSGIGTTSVAGGAGSAVVIGAGVAGANGAVGHINEFQA